MSKRILVPMDLVSDGVALIGHALEMAQLYEAKIILYHTIKDEHFKEEAISYLSKRKEYFIDFIQYFDEPVVEMGDYHRTIPVYAEENKVSLVVIETPGIKGFQRITGSDALKLVSSSFIPFMIVQKRLVRETGYKKTVFPLQFRRQTLEELNFFVETAREFNEDIHFVISDEKNPLFNQKYIDEFIQHMDANGLKYTFSLLPGNEDFNKLVVRYAASIDADLICGLNFSYEFLYTIFARTEEETLIYNEAQIPVMLISPKNQIEDIYYSCFLWH